MKNVETAVILGSGLGGFASAIDISKIIPYSDIDDFPVSTVEGHKGQFVIGDIKGVPVVLMQGRVHLYEGYTPQDVVKPIRFLKNLGIKNLIITNAAGGINENYEAGDLVLIKDQITSFVPSPLIGVNLEKEGYQRFPDMTHVYDDELSQLVKKAADDLELPLKEGVYLQTTGPQYETPAEIRMYRTLGADLVGMSTSVEATFAHAIGMKVVGLSCVTNLAAGMSGKELSHEEVSEVANTMNFQFSSLLKIVIERI